MYYKILLNGKNIDVFTELTYVKYDTKARLVLLCNDDENPNGVASQRTGLYYHVQDFPNFPETIDVSTVVLSEINETEYFTILAELEKGGELEQRIKELETENKELQDAVVELAGLIS